MVSPADETVAKMFFANVVLPDPGTARFMRTVFIRRANSISKNAVMRCPDHGMKRFWELEDFLVEMSGNTRLSMLIQDVTQKNEERKIT